MTDQDHIANEIADEAEAIAPAPSLSEVSARRLAARTQWQMALARAKERFTPANLGNEMVEKAADTIGGAADKAGSAAWAHRGKIAVAGLLGGLLFWRKPIAKAATPLAQQAKVTASKAAQSLRNHKKV
jgi:ElaB/YqjD/DUF883 family membrane-anchored ribosome-binding protein